MLAQPTCQAINSADENMFQFPQISSRFPLDDEESKAHNKVTFQAMSPEPSSEGYSGSISNQLGSAKVPDLPIEEQKLEEAWAEEEEEEAAADQEEEEEEDEEDDEEFD